MKVVIEEHLFERSGLDAHLTALILVGALDWGHRVLVEEDPGAPGAALERWLAKHAHEVAEGIRSALDFWALEEADPARGGWPDAELRVSPDASEWTPPGGGPPRLCIEDVFACIRRPFEVHLEDDTTDRAFLLSIAPPEVAALLRHLEERGSLIFLGGGVSNMIRRLEPLVDGLRGRAGLIRRRRMWAMVDSDARRPAGPGGRVHHSRDVKTLIAVCRKLMGEGGIWALRRRFIESYLPRERLKAHAETQGLTALFEAWCALDEGRRHTFNMKDGLTGDRKAERLWHKYRAFWDGCAPVLDEGFGDVGRLYIDEALHHADFDADAQAEAQERLPHLVRRP